MSAIVEARGLCRSFGSTRAEDAVDLDLAPGEMLGLVGPDGAGKTTTIRLLAGVLAPDAGRPACWATTWYRSGTRCAATSGTCPSSSACTAT